MPPARQRQASVRGEDANDADFGIPCGDERKLHKPSFASPLAALRATPRPESPTGFRSRNLFVSENALTRVCGGSARPTS